MKSLFIKYKSVIRFILTFLLVYMFLSVVYKFYLQFSDGSKFYPDYVTNLVSKQTESLLNTLGYQTMLASHSDVSSIQVYLKGDYVGYIVEGCNSISVIILFVSFIIAFSGKLKTTLFYVLSGSVLIYVVNLLRIVILILGLYHYPEQADVMHSVVFPAIIYGMVFLLWVFWVNRFSKLNKKHA